MEYSQIVEELYKALPIFQRVGAAAYKDNLNNTIALMKMMDNPEKKIKTIHVAGTNGKGSTSSFLASILMENGLKVGLHTSPHLKDLRERIVINGRMCGKIYIIDFMNKYREEIQKISPSFFELMVAMAFNYFEKKHVDIAVVEVGMGGRLDSTNVIMPEVSVITNISYDHTQFLGKTLPLIAKEKAGIIKKNTPVVISQTQEEVKDVFNKKAKEMNSKITFADKVFCAKNIRNLDNKLIMDIYKKGKLYIKNLTSSLNGMYQVKNILGVIATIEELNNNGYCIGMASIINGIKNVQKNFPLYGRWQTLSLNPLTLCDTGHNEDGLRYVTTQLKALNYKHLNFVFGMVNDKDIDKELTLLPKDDVTYFLCKANIPRGLDVNVLEKKFIDNGFTCKKYSSVKEALSFAQEDAIKTLSTVFIGGSTYTVAEIV
jgi:dihydrofolate synthase/folylpolyglutamate synthase